MKKGMYLWVCMLLLLLIPGCKDDNLDRIHPGKDEAVVVLTIKTPSASIPRPETRAVQNAAETAVSTIKVLVFDDTAGDGNYGFRYMVDGTQIEPGGNQSTQFQVLLRLSSVALRLLIVTNYADAFANFVPSLGMSEAAVKAGVNMNFTSTPLTGNLPMYGRVDLPNLDPTNVTILNTTILRSVARVDVVTELFEGSPAFTLREVYVYRANNRIQIMPDSTVQDGTLRVTTPFVPVGAGALAQAVIKTSPSLTDSIGGVYIPESAASAQGVQNHLTATTVVVGGVFGSDQQISYYRADFNSGIQGHPFGQVLRNYLYKFTIHRVSASGWPTPDEAAQNVASSLTVELQQWEDFTTDMYFHDRYIGVSTRQVDMPFLPDYTRVIDIESTMNYEMQWVAAPDSGVVSEINTPLSDGYFTATIFRNAGEADNISHIRIESSRYNITDQPVDRVLRLTAEDTAVDINIRKESPSQYSDRTIRVLSVGYYNNYGSLGQFDLIPSYAQSMRNVMDVNFSPSSTYPFKTGGFFFINVASSSAIYSAATDPAAVNNFKRFIENFDVLIMTYANVTSDPVTNMLLDEWLVDKPNRVLWLMIDSSASNVNITNRTAREGEGAWVTIGNALNTTAGFRYSAPADYAYDNAREVYEFFNGPFGTINNTNPQQILLTGDATAQVTLLPDSSKQYVTPLVYSNNDGYRGYMVMGINKDRGIVYQGEAQLFQTGVGMSSASGTNGTIVTTPDPSGKYYYDLLNANIWAWVTGRVIYGRGGG